jgi:hypothetical protein
MSQVAKSASALERAFLAILVLEAMEVRLFRPLKLAGVHGDRWTVRLGFSIDVSCPRLAPDLAPGDLPMPPLLVLRVLSGRARGARLSVGRLGHSRVNTPGTKFLWSCIAS